MPGQDASGQWDAYICARWIWGNFTNPNFSVAVPKCLYLGCVVLDRTSVFSLYRNSDLYDKIYECFVTSMTAVSAKVLRASFLLICDLNDTHQQWLDNGFYYHKS